MSQVVHIRGHSAGISSSDEEIAGREEGVKLHLQHGKMISFAPFALIRTAAGNVPTKDIIGLSIITCDNTVELK